MEEGGILKAGLFLAFKMWPVATPDPQQMGPLQSSPKPHVLTVAGGLNALQLCPGGLQNNRECEQ